MHTLHVKHGGKTEREQQRAASARMATDMEMNGALRGAVEEYNLCVNLRSNNVLLAECKRTFNTVHVNAQQWLHRFEAELEQVAEMQACICPGTTLP